MKKSLILLTAILLVFSCSPQKNTVANRAYQSFSAYYNTLFNSKDALETELRTRSENHRDNFYAPYINLLTYENDFATENLNDGENSANAGALQIAERKALKAIEKHSMNFNGVEKNKRIFDASLLLAKARIYQNKPLEALDALNYVFNSMKTDKRLPLARIYEGVAYTKMKNFFRAEETFAELKKTRLSANDKKLLSIHYAEMLVAANRLDQAVNELSEAYAFNKNKELRSRIAFLRGQVLAQLGKNEQARQSFAQAYEDANDFEFEVKSQIEIAKTFNGKKEDYSGARNYLSKISEKGTYASRRNEFYYALGLMATQAGNAEEAREFYRKSVAGKASDPQIRGLAYYELGKLHQNENDYLGAGIYYDSAYAAMTYTPAKNQLRDLTKNIKEISQNYYLIRKNDSILSISKMNEAQRSAYFGKFIAEMRKKEMQEEAEQKKAQKNSFETVSFKNEGNALQNLLGNNKGGFYFANASTVAKGQTEFKQIWGNRSLSDNWRTASTSAGIDELRNQALGLTAVKDPRRYELSFYTERIPRDALLLENLKKERDTATLGLGRMYFEHFQNAPLATKTLYTLLENRPEENVRLQALYQLFAMNFEKNPAEAAKVKEMILREFPYTPLAEYVKNPRNAALASNNEAENLYQNAFSLYNEGRFEDSKTIIDSALSRFPSDALSPKFALLNAFNTGKTAGKEIMILQLQQIVLNYDKTPEGIKAKEMLKFLESDLVADVLMSSDAVQIPVQNTVSPDENEPNGTDEPAQIQPSSVRDNRSNRVRPVRNIAPQMQPPPIKPKK